MGAWDHPTRSHKQFIDIHCAGQRASRRMFLPGQLGWWALKTLDRRPGRADLPRRHRVPDGQVPGHRHGLLADGHRPRQHRTRSRPCPAWPPSSAATRTCATRARFPSRSRRGYACRAPSSPCRRSGRRLALPAARSTPSTASRRAIGAACGESTTLSPRSRPGCASRPSCPPGPTTRRATSCGRLHDAGASFPRRPQRAIWRGAEAVPGAGQGGRRQRPVYGHQSRPTPHGAWTPSSGRLTRR